MGSRLGDRVGRMSRLYAVMVCVCAFGLFQAASAQTQPLLQITSPADGTVVSPGRTVTVGAASVTPPNAASWSDSDVTVSSGGQTSAQPLLKIVSPAGLEVVHPGDEVRVVVTAVRGKRPDQVGLIVQFPLQLLTPSPLRTPPYEFTVKVPSKVDKAGLYSVGGAGAAGRTFVVARDAISLDVEPSAPVVKMLVDLDEITFAHRGEQMPILVTASFADHTVMTITNSTEITYKSLDPRVATVSSEGVVTAVGDGPAGHTEILVQFENKTVTVEISLRNLERQGPA